ncbi:MAG TPA: class I SAM-dependent methyltransferase [Pseudolabrys sp.]|jgi:SAM-dependent methyltransferase|nr:class I SAM-dependent methyltransferase [Pseudolabrys sp.]
MNESVTELKAELLRSLNEGAPPNVALMRLLLHAEQADDARCAIEAALAASIAPYGAGIVDGLHQVERLWKRNPDAWKTVRTIGRGHARPHPSADHALDYWSAAYDEVVRISPEGSVALYSLGNIELLNAATAEVVSYLRGMALLGFERRLLELGCGIGRLVEALAPEVGLAVGVDISAEMVRHAERRCRVLANVKIARCSGRDLAPFADSSFDVVLAADVFPYIFEAGDAVVRNTLRESARVLAPNGAMVVLNFSYRGRPEADRADLAQFAGALGFDIVENGACPFRLWDGLAFVLKKRAE